MKTLNEKTLGIRSKIEVGLTKHMYEFSIPILGREPNQPCLSSLTDFIVCGFHAVINHDSNIL